MTVKQLAALLRVNAVDPDKDLPAKECMERFEKAPEYSQAVWLRKAEKYLKELKELE